MLPHVTPRPAPCFLRHLPLLVPALALAACSGGGSETSAPPATSADPRGEWNFFRDGVACTGEEFDALSMDIVDDPGGGFMVRIGDVADPFTFEATLVGGLLEISGTDTVGDTTLEITSATWGFSSDGNVMQGVMNVVRTEAGTPCQVQDAITAYRVDATSTSLAAGPWEWSALTVGSEGNCVGVGSTEFLPVTVHPAREGRFVLEITTENGDSLQFEATFDGINLFLGGSDVDADGKLITILAGSSVSVNPSGGTSGGLITVEIDGGCWYLLDIDAVRPSVGRTFLPYIEDMAGQQSIVGVDPLDPSSPVVLVASIGDPEYGQSLNPLTLRSFTARGVRRTYDPAAREVIGEQVDTLYYRVGDDIMQLDLAIREDAFGERIERDPRRVYDGSGGGIFGLTALGDLSGANTVLVFTDGAEEMFVEVDRAGGARSAGVSGGGSIVGLTYDDDGDYDRAIVRVSSTGDLVTQNVTDGVELVRSEVLDVVMGVDGSAYFRRAGRVDVLEAVTGQVRFVRNIFGAVHSLGVPQGETLCLTEEFGGSLRMMRTTPSGNASQLAGTSDVSSSGGSPSPPIVVGERVLTRIRAGGGGVRLLSAPVSGGEFQTLLDSAAADEFPTGSGVARLADRAYFNTVEGPQFTIAALDPLASPPVEETLPGHSVIATLHDPVFPLEQGRRGTSLVLRDGAGMDQNTLRVVDLATNPMGLLSSVRTLFEPASVGGGTYVDFTGRQGLAADLSSSSPTTPASQMFFLDLDGTAAPLPLAGNPGEFSLPIP